jgi:hypothetical protein
MIAVTIALAVATAMKDERHESRLAESSFLRPKARPFGSPVSLTPVKDPEWVANVSSNSQKCIP